MAKVKIIKSSITGKFVSKKKAKKSPKTTFTQVVNKVCGCLKAK